MRDKYFQFVRLDDSVTELYIYGDIRKPDIIEKWLEIDDDTRVDAFTFKDALNEVDTPNLVVRINSFGGDVSEGLAIYSLLSDFKGNLITKVDGFACSAASVIFMAGKERIMPESGLLMIHNAWTKATGDSNELRKAANDLEVITEPSVNIYVSKTGLSVDEVKKMMDDETWMDYKLAFEKGFATSIEKDGEAQQSIANINNYIRRLVSENTDLKMRFHSIKNQQVENSKPETSEIIVDEINENKNDWSHFFN